MGDLTGTRMEQKMSPLNLLYLDFETYFNRQDGYTLTEMSMVEYLRDPRFLIQGCGVFYEDKYLWFKTGTELKCWITERINLKNTAVVAHNCRFDAAILAWKLDIVPALLIDTQSMSYAVNGTTIGSHSLDSLAHHYGFEPKGHLNTDGKKVLTPAEESQLIEYGLHDVELLVQIYRKLEKDFPKSQYGPMDWTIRTFIQPSLVLDVPLLEQCAIKEKARRDAFFTRPGWEKERFSSNKKFPELLKENGYEVPTKISPRTGQEIPALALGDPQFLDMLEGDDEKLGEICEARVAAKSTLLETRAEKLARIGKTGSWPFDIWFSGAKQTHRYSGGNASGGNPQNFKRGSDLRKAVSVPAGKTLVVGDFAQIELRINAWLSGDKKLQKQLANGEDVYSIFASEYYQRTITKDNKDERQFGKTAVLGLGYSAAWGKFQKIVRLQMKKEITEQEARRAVDLFRSMYWWIPKTWDYLHNLLPQMADGGFGELQNCPAVKIDGTNFILPSGLVIRYPNLRQQEVKGRMQWCYDAYRKGKQKEVSIIYGAKMLENLCQALAGEICKEAIEKYRDIGTPVGACHDEILAVENGEEAAVMTKNLKICMETAPKWFPGLVLNAEVNIGLNWLEAK